MFHLQSLGEENIQESLFSNVDFRKRKLKVLVGIQVDGD